MIPAVDPLDESPDASAARARRASVHAVLAATGAWRDGRPCAPGPARRAALDSYSRLTLEGGALEWPGLTQRERERSAFAAAVFAAMPDPLALLRTVFDRYALTNLRGWCATHGLVDAWIPPTLACGGAAYLLERGDGTAVVICTDGEFRMLPAPPRQAPLAPRNYLTETDADYQARAGEARAQDEDAWRALGYVDARPKRGAAKTRDFRMLAERIVHRNSWADLARRYCRGPAYGTTARNAVNRTACRIGLTLPPD